jgi:hypothetical protein
MSVTNDSFRDWRANPVTKAVFEELGNRIRATQAELGNSAGLDPLSDRFKVGAIQAYQDMLFITFSEVKDGD